MRRSRNIVANLAFFFTFSTNIQITKCCHNLWDTIMLFCTSIMLLILIPKSVSDC